MYVSSAAFLKIGGKLLENSTLSHPTGMEGFSFSVEHRTRHIGPASPRQQLGEPVALCFLLLEGISSLAVSKQPGKQEGRKRDRDRGPQGCQERDHVLYS